MDERSRHLEQVIATQVADLGDNLEALSQKAKTLVDWRAQVDAHPLGMVGLAVAGGAIASTMGRRRRGPRHVTDESLPVRVRRSSGMSMLLRDIQFALAGVATTAVVEFLGEAVPGFGNHYRPSQTRPEHAGSADGS